MNRLIPATAAVLLFTSFIALEYGGKTPTAEGQSAPKTVAEVAFDELTDDADEVGAAELVAAQGDAMAAR